MVRLPSGRVWVKIAGMAMASTDRSSMLDVMLIEFLLKVWVLNFTPPQSMDMPSTSRMLPITEPASDALTTSNIPAFIATNAMISSVALPKVAFRSPPIFCPQKHAITSVLLPMIPASGMIASELHTNRRGSERSIRSPIIVTGRNISNIYRNFIPRSPFDWLHSLYH